MPLMLDHLALCSPSLEAGAAHLENVLGVPLSEGGKHAHMGTHNRLLGVGSDLYLEVIAIDPQAPTPAHPRWFDLDSFKGAPRLTNWVARSDDLAQAVARAPAGIGVPTALERGDLRWEMAVPADGKLPFDGAYPALIHWSGRRHPAGALPESGVRLHTLRVFHPDAEALRAALGAQLDDPRVDILQGARPALEAQFDTPAGRRILR